MKAFITFQHGNSRVGTLHLELYDQIVPKTVENFVTLLSRPKCYLGSNVHRLIRGFMLQAGDFTAGDGTGGYSIYGKTFADENFVYKHNRPGMLSMANAGPNTNGSQFFITFRATPHLDGKHVVFGHVDMEKSGHVLNALEQIRTGANDRPVQALSIVDCGVVSSEDSEKPTAVSNVAVNDKDEDEIDLDEEDDRNEADQKNEDNPAVSEEPFPDEEEDDDQPVSKEEALKRRLRRLKQKMNQARQLNNQAVKQEGERSSVEGAARERKMLAANRQKAKQQEFVKQNAKALETASATGVDGKYLTEQASDSVYKAMIQAEKDDLNQYTINDYHNPEGQYRNYQRNIKSLPRHAAAASTDTYNPLENEADPEQERQGARRIAEELHRRIEKKQKREMKRKEREDDGDVSYINQRNKRFNEKINRTYDKHTAEIRQNLERGTAL